MNRMPEAFWLIVVAAVLLAAVAYQRHSSVSPPSAPTPSVPRVPTDGFAIRGVRLFDGEQVTDAATVVVRNGRIEAVGTDIALPDGIAVIEGAGRTLLPGLIDAHTHSFGAARQQALQFGVTTEVDLHGDRQRLTQIRRERESLDRTDQADLWAAGVALTVAGGHGTQYGFAVPTIDADTDIRAFVDARVDEGADFIKLIVEDLSVYSEATRWPTLSPEQVAAIAAAAHARDRRAIAHVSRERDAAHALTVGVDGLAHVFVDAPVSEALLAAAARTRPFVIPTLSVTAAETGAGDGASLLADPRLRPWLAADQAATLAARFPSTARTPAYRRQALENVRRLQAAGVVLLAGTDAGNPGTAHGASLHGELELLTRAGLSPVQALAAATAVPARVLGLADRGRIAAGHRADLILVDGDPTRDITATRALVGIWKNGQAVARTPAAAAAASDRGAEVPAATVISTFDGASIDAAFGAGWHATTDQMIAGRSTAAHRLVQPGASGSAGALEVAGEIVAGAAFPWAGVVFFPASEAMQPVDLSARRELVFLARGDGREYNAMLLSGPTMQGMPAIRTFVAGPDWTPVRLPLSAFGGADLSRVRGIGFTAGDPPGRFRFQVDQVELR
ncbi:CIA30 family protein [Dokdonella koreensis]|uniref:Hydrolase n=1 Tax=Dokdonella koreensis DS-123 TaxID=1300342 RepID=A0A160DYM3_9GAMM|nr:CIA30 family protein [Dokdonella koreensis]ANB19183.1 Putative hydrolase [Dokdonella koreensis DS-123]